MLGLEGILLLGLILGLIFVLLAVSLTTEEAKT